MTETELPTAQAMAQVVVFVLAGVFCYILGGMEIEVRKIKGLPTRHVAFGWVFMFLVWCFFLFSAGAFSRWVGSI